MKVPWKGLAILAILIAAVVYDIPTVLTHMPKDDAVEKAKIVQEYERIQGLYRPLRQLQLALVESAQNRIRLIAEDGFEWPEDNPVLQDIVQDNFSVQKSDGGWVLQLKKDADDKVFVTDVGNKLNGMLTNVRKIEEISLGENSRSVIFKVAKNKRLSQKIEPMKSFLGDTFEITYREEASQYVTRLKTMENVIDLGLDLLGGMYLDIGVKTEDVVVAVLDRMVEEIEDNLTYDNVNYENVNRISDRALEILLEPDEAFELQGENYTRLLERNYDVTPITSGYLITIKEDEVARIKKRAVEQALETIRNRIDQLGVKEPTIQQQGENSIVIQLPGESDPDKARRIIGTVAILTFQLVAETGSMDNPTEDQTVLYEEIRDPVTKEVVSTRPYLLLKKVLMQGDRIRDSRVNFLQTTGAPYVGMSFDDIGKDEFAEITRNNVGRRLAIVLDGKVQSAPRINEEIPSGEAQITGSFTAEEATELALVLRSGSLPAPIIINEERTVGPSLGADSIRQSLIALCLGFAAVMLFMMIYYEVAGIFSVMALIFNLLLIGAALAVLQATLTLPGMAGIVLTIGMAVDANVLIFERIREEIARGNPIRTAINVGFKRATVTILDANITTILAAIVLGQFGTGAIRGFAITLIIGIAASLFTSIIVGRLLFEIVYLRRPKLEKISI
jgi:preprotein translocase subunit SecD